jgi:hypothetical protein
MNLTNVDVEVMNPAYSDVDGVLFNKGQDIIMKYPEARAGDYAMPDGVATVGDQAFVACYGLSGVTMSASVTKISSSAFSGCSSLTEIRIPASVTSIGDKSFAHCTNLTSAYFEGHAPSIGVDVLTNANFATVYYVPGTTGWAPTYAGRPTAIWQPNVQTDDPSFGLINGRFGFNISWASDQVVVVEACESLTNPTWSSAGTNTSVSGTSYFSDPEWGSWPQRFYRLRSL